MRHLFSSAVVAVVLALSGCGYDEGEYVATPDTSCGPHNCSNGCCLGNTCQPGTVDMMCGKGGSACVTCQTGERCSPDKQPVCEPKLAPTSSWAVHPFTATIKPQDPADGLNWDADDSPPDVVVVLTCPTDGDPIERHTSEVSSLTPSWTDGECTSTAGALLKSPVIVKVIDVDFAVDDPIAYFQYTLKEADFEAGSVSLIMPGDVGTLTLRLVPRQQGVTAAHVSWSDAARRE